MTNLALEQKKKGSNLFYPDFAANAARKTVAHEKRILAIQHRYGVLLLLASLTSIAVTLSSEVDFSAFLVLVPLSLVLLFSKKTLLYTIK